MAMLSFLPVLLALLAGAVLLSIAAWLRRSWRREAATQSDDQPKVLHRRVVGLARNALMIPLLVVGVGACLFGVALIPKAVSTFHGARAFYSLKLRCSADQVVLENPLEYSFIARIDSIDIPTGVDSICPVEDFRVLEHRFEPHESFAIGFRWPTWTDSVRDVKTLAVHIMIVDDDDTEGRPIVPGDKRSSTPFSFVAKRTCPVEASRR